MEQQEQVQIIDSQSRNGGESDSPLSRVCRAPQKRKAKQCTQTTGGESTSGTKKRVKVASYPVLPERHPELNRNLSNEFNGINCSNIHLLSRIKVLERKLEILCRYVDDLEESIAKGESSSDESLN